MAVWNNRRVGITAFFRVLKLPSKITRQLFACVCRFETVCACENARAGVSGDFIEMKNRDLFVFLTRVLEILMYTIAPVFYHPIYR